MLRFIFPHANVVNFVLDVFNVKVPVQGVVVWS